MFVLLLDEKTKMQVSDVQLLLFHELLNFTGNLNSCSGHWVWNSALGKPQISTKEKKEREKNPTLENHILKDLLNASAIQ